MRTAFARGRWRTNRRNRVCGPGLRRTRLWGSPEPTARRPRRSWCNCMLTAGGLSCEALRKLWATARRCRTWRGRSARQAVALELSSFQLEIDRHLPARCCGVAQFCSRSHGSLSRRVEEYRAAKAAHLRESEIRKTMSRWFGSGEDVGELRARNA